MTFMLTLGHQDDDLVGTTGLRSSVGGLWLRPAAHGHIGLKGSRCWELDFVVSSGKCRLEASLHCAEVV